MTFMRRNIILVVDMDEHVTFESFTHYFTIFVITLSIFHSQPTHIHLFQSISFKKKSQYVRGKSIKMNRVRIGVIALFRFNVISLKNFALCTVCALAHDSTQ